MWATLSGKSWPSQGFPALTPLLLAMGSSSHENTAPTLHCSYRTMYQLQLHAKSAPATPVMNPHTEMSDYVFTVEIYCTIIESCCLQRASLVSMWIDDDGMLVSPTRWTSILQHQLLLCFGEDHPVTVMGDSGPICDLLTTNGPATEDSRKRSWQRQPLCVGTGHSPFRHADGKPRL